MMYDIEEALEQAESNAPKRNCKIVKKGILSKKSRSKYISGPWTLRTVILDSDNRLSYYDGKVLKGEVLLAGTMVNHVTQDVADGKTFPFQISNISLVKRSQTTALLLAAGSFQEADDWVTHLSKAAVGSTSTGAAGYITFEVSSSHGSLSPLSHPLRKLTTGGGNK
jgi:hypothetical protein